MAKQYTYFGQYFDSVLVSGYEDGVKFDRRIKYEPFLFKRGEGKFRTVDDKSVDHVEFSSISHARKFLREQEDSGEPVWGFTNFPYVHIFENYDDMESNANEFKVLDLDIETDSENGYGDSQKADREIISISLKVHGKPDMYVIGFKEYSEPKDPELLQLIADGKIRIRYMQVADEAELLRAIIKIFNHVRPDIITGWNVEAFDIPYIVKRIIQILGGEEAKKLSPFKLVNQSEVMIFNKPQDRFEIVGIPVIDYMVTFKKFAFKNFESYKLDYICQERINARKLDYSEYGTLAKLYKENPTKFYDYNIIDVYRVEQLDMKEKFIDQVIMLAHMAKVNLVDTFTTVRIWDVLIHNYLLEQGIVVPTSNSNHKLGGIAGGHVKDPQIGKHNMVMSFDVTSLYPHVIMMFNLSPETLRGKFKPVPMGPESVDFILNGGMAEHTSALVKNTATVTGKGTVFSVKQSGFLPAIMKKLFSQRKQFKAEMIKWEDELQQVGDDKERKLFVQQKIAEFNNKQMAMKILLNSGYGACSNEHFRWYSDDIAESVTLSGQLIIRTTEIYLNRFMNEYLGTSDIDYIVAIDTDSNYINVEQVAIKQFGSIENADKAELLKFMEKFAVQLEEVIQEGFNHLYDTLNVFDKCLHMKLEAIGAAVWVAKKRYVMSVISNEGVHYDPPKIKMQGIDAVRSSTPQVCRSKIKEAIPLIIAGDRTPLKKHIDDFREEWNQMPFHMVASPRGVSDIDKYYDHRTIYRKGEQGATPIAARGALLFNHAIRTNGLQNTYEPIRNGDKVRFCYMELPNPFNENVFAVPDEMPPELGYEKYIDYYKQFQKTFYGPLENIIHAAGIDVSDTVDISAFFVDYEPNEKSETIYKPYDHLEDDDDEYSLTDFGD
ncbi:DNA polymerase family B protein [Rhizobium phage RHph_I1_18]|nr:DNA polymerase family B protein [Rhizobium phage RHph_I1_18]